MRPKLCPPANPDNRSAHSDFYTKRVLRRAVEHTKASLFLRGASHTLAYALWLANERRGKLLACMESLSRPGEEPAAVSYGHMAYSDANGQLWDAVGPQARTRYEQARKRAHSRQKRERNPKGEHLKISFDWVEVHPSNLFAFLDEWKATHPVDQSQVEALTQDVLRDSGEVAREHIPGQIDIFGDTHFERDLCKAPYTEVWYRRMHRAGHVAYAIPLEHAQITIFEAAA